MKNTVLAAFFFLILLPEVFSQQEAQFSHNMFNNMGINPGYAGLRNAIVATGLVRQQWVGFKDQEDNNLNPETYSLNVDAPLPFLRGGVALGFIQDKLGYETNIGARVSYSYHHKLSSGVLGIGAQIGFIDKRIDFSNFNPINEGDPVLSGGAEESHMFMDFALGTFYVSENNGWAGLSVSQITQSGAEIGPAMYSLKRHVYLSGGYDLPFGANQAIDIKPSLLVKTDFSTVQFDINTLVSYNNRFWGGVSYRLQDAVAFLVGLNIEQISVGYSYDVTTSPIGGNGRSYGSHEIMLQYSFQLDVEKLEEIQRNIRFL